jgi:hypothetical protein
MAMLACGLAHTTRLPLHLGASVAVALSRGVAVLKSETVDTRGGCIVSI